MRTVLIGLGVVIAIPVTLAIVAAVVGLFLPATHTATRRMVVNHPVSEVFALIADRASHPAWRPEVKRVEVVSPTRFVEHDARRGIPFEVVESTAPTRYVTRIADESLPFGGTWTTTLAPEGDGTAVTITEDGIVRNPIFRTVSTFVIGHTATMDRFLAALAAKCGSPSNPG